MFKNNYFSERRRTPLIIANVIIFSQMVSAKLESDHCTIQKLPVRQKHGNYFRK